MDSILGHSIRIDSGFEQFGLLIEKWSAGEILQPKTVGELKKAAADFSAEIKLRVNAPDSAPVYFNTMYADSVYINLPAKEDLEKTKEIIDKAQQEGGDYPMPTFYGETHPWTNEGGELHKIRLSRIADYCTQKCM